ncbi:UPF0193 protein EVG1 homolog [Bacillus rossius redtenbacheri]|uniref:UPF0193 protein EVG1 homolog n=1 Tax=Bacillus rossius redtenbacheri TaxID=93214 RepID=UPI002FDDE535
MYREKSGACVRRYTRYTVTDVEGGRTRVPAALLAESRLTTLQRRRVEGCVRRGESLPRDEQQARGRPARRRARSCVPLGRAKRSRAAIEQSGAYEPDSYWPTRPAVDLEKEKLRLQGLMAFGKELPPSPRRKAAKGRREPLRTPDREAWFDELVREVEDRVQFLAEMKELGADREYRPLVEQEIAAKVRQMEALDGDRCRRMDDLAGRCRRLSLGPTS